MAIIWPQIVGGIYASPTSMYAGYLNCVPGAMIVVGMVLGGLLAEPIGKTNYQVITAFIIGGALIGGKSHMARDMNPITHTIQPVPVLLLTTSQP
jgi:flagellar motor component MotA